MIPKIIHYCWFGGGTISEKECRCIESWKKMCPDYEIVEWNESNYDITKCKYMYDAYKEKKWGFVPDYARLDIIYKYGGIYLDTDVELVKPFPALLLDNAFMGFEDGKYINLGLIFGAEKNNNLIKEIRDNYNDKSFYLEDGALNLKPSPIYSTEILIKHGLLQNNKKQIIEGIHIYPSEYFCPRDYISGKVKLTSKTVSIHWFNASWKTEKEKAQLELIYKLSKVFGKTIGRNFAEYKLAFEENGISGVSDITKEKIKRKQMKK